MAGTPPIKEQVKKALEELWASPITFFRKRGDKLLHLSNFVLLVALLILVLLKDNAAGHVLLVLLIVFAAIVSLATLLLLNAPNESKQNGGGDGWAGRARWISPIVSLLLLLYLTFWGLMQFCPGCLEPVQSQVCIVALPLAVVLLVSAILVVWFLATFCTKLTQGLVAPQEEIIPMVRYCYVFTITAFVASLAPLFGILFMDSQFYMTMLRSPIGLVKGCVHSTDSTWELACADNDPFKAQWMLNIGGSVRLTNYVPSKGPQPQASATPTMAVPDLWIPSDTFRPTVIVHGGLVVPWYFIALALMGAAVSLARKVPEYQRRAISATDSMDGPTAREYLEFQILQLLSAPLIALAVYNVIDPTSLKVSAVLGFSAGFSSEAILLVIRKALDGIVGVSPTATPGSIDDSVMVSTITALLFRDEDLLTKNGGELKTADIQVDVKNGEVTLTGTLIKPEAISRAEELAGSVPGVKKVTPNFSKQS